MRIKLTKTDSSYKHPIRIMNLDFTEDGNEVDIDIADYELLLAKREVKKTSDFSITKKFYKDITDVEVISAVEETPVEETPVEETPVEETPVEETPVEETPDENVSIEAQDEKDLEMSKNKFAEMDKIDETSEEQE